MVEVSAQSRWHPASYKPKDNGIELYENLYQTQLTSYKALIMSTGWRFQPKADGTTFTTTQQTITQYSVKLSTELDILL